MLAVFIEVFRQMSAVQQESTTYEWPDLCVPDSNWRPHRVLVCRPNSRLGNTLLLTPLLEELERRFPGAEVDVLTSCPAAEQVFREFSCIRTIHQLPRLGVRHPLAHVLTYLRARRIRYDLIIDPNFRSRSARFALRFLRGDVKIGFSPSHSSRGITRSLPSSQVPRHMGIHPVHLLRGTVPQADGSEDRTDVPRLNIHLTAIEQRDGEQKLLQVLKDVANRPVLAVCLMATGAKRLPEAWWREMLAVLGALRPDIRTIEIVPATGISLLRDYPGYFSSDIRRVAAVIAASDCFVCADGGLMHLAAATSTTTVGLFNVTNPTVYAPYGGRNTAICVNDVAPEAVARHVATLVRALR